MKMNDEQIVSLAKFALDILGEWPDVSMMDGGDLQEIAERHKLLVPQIVHAPCNDDDCVCAEMCSDEDFARGVTCYHIADWLIRSAELRNEAERAGAESSGMTYSCPRCNHARNRYDDYVQVCLHCGDAEIFLERLG